MEAMIARCCGLDVHQGSVVACVVITEARRKIRREIRSFGTVTKDLEALRDWLMAEGVTHVAMESRVCIGDPSIICCVARSFSWSPMPTTSGMFRDGKPT